MIAGARYVRVGDKSYPYFAANSVTDTTIAASGPKSKIVQLIAVPGLVARGWFRDRVVASPALYALCKDGTVWVAKGSRDRPEWSPFTDFADAAFRQYAGAIASPWVTINEYKPVAPTVKPVTTPPKKRPSKKRVKR